MGGEGFYCGGRAGAGGGYGLLEVNMMIGFMMDGIWWM